MNNTLQHYDIVNTLVKSYSELNEAGHYTRRSIGITGVYSIITLFSTRILSAMKNEGIRRGYNKGLTPPSPPTQPHPPPSQPPRNKKQHTLTYNKTQHNGCYIAIIDNKYWQDLLYSLHSTVYPQNTKNPTK